ncbi:uncharacterized protein K460DRAFT_181484 [Cucurbitaria berberidis CBS 394.84]|uniref:Uncharacterized protein n=1 Tax=Cucurbitaria berberidis CBS 394.84 TaxID=1168544 RepID=A0A9P4GAL9_9PLEO|nr:uncharacterized protein K460DRAFT_181484 [Cucurbitaria berberidis CBS 394.84]KAF1842263.1 hypothetical protein K460DRAFT_181484 [Cucurbitaria berberidis CBS 394.84]
MERDTRCLHSSKVMRRRTGEFRNIGTHTASNPLRITRVCGFGRSMCCTPICCRTPHSVWPSRRGLHANICATFISNNDILHESIDGAPTRSSDGTIVSGTKEGPDHTAHCRNWTSRRRRRLVCHGWLIFPAEATACLNCCFHRSSSPFS